MKLKNKLAAIALVSITLSTNARHVVSGDVVARDLLIWGLGWAGHVGMVTGDPVGGSSSLIIEAMEDGFPHAIVFNNITNFKKQSKYWGSRFGLLENTRTHTALAEMNHQRWWCPSYTPTADYKVGRGNIYTGQIYECGTWRCDTSIAWSYYFSGYNAMLENAVILPWTVFYTFPYANDGLKRDNTSHPPLLTSTDKVFSDLSADELNKLPYDEFEMIADTPIRYATPTQIVTTWKFANDAHVNEAKRGLFIDKLSMSNEPDVIPRFIKMYDQTSSDELKRKLITGTVIYYQGHDEQVKNSQDRELLRVFYKRVLNEKIDPRAVEMAVRGFNHFYSVEEIIEHRTFLDKKFSEMHHLSVLSLQLEMSHRAQELETIYLPSLIKMLKEDNDSNLNEMFFGLTAHSWIHFRNKKSIKLIKDYVKFAAVKYENKNPCFSDMNDPYFVPATQTYNEIKSTLFGSNYHLKSVNHSMTSGTQTSDLKPVAAPPHDGRNGADGHGTNGGGRGEDGKHGGNGGKGGNSDWGRGGDGGNGGDAD